MSSLENTQPSPPDIDRALVIANEHSSNARRMSREIAQLEIPTRIITTSRDPRYTEEALRAAARPGDVLLGAGGDGTANQIANMLLSPEGQEEGLHHLPFIPLRGGNANDIASMINGRKTAAQILRLGQDTYLHPLEIRTKDPEERVRLALGYFSAGATAAASQRLDEIKNTANAFTRATGLQLAREAIATWLTVSRAEAFKLQQEGVEAASVTDYLILRGDRIAKLGKPHADLRAAAFEALPSTSAGLKDTLVDMIKMQQGRSHGEMRNEVNFGVESADGTPVALQFDGETVNLQSGGQVSVGISEVPYRTLSTKL